MLKHQAASSVSANNELEFVVPAIEAASNLSYILVLHKVGSVQHVCGSIMDVFWRVVIQHQNKQRGINDLQIESIHFRFTKFTANHLLQKLFVAAIC